MLDKNLIKKENVPIAAIKIYFLRKNRHNQNINNNELTRIQEDKSKVQE